MLTFHCTVLDDPRRHDYQERPSSFRGVDEQTAMFQNGRELMEAEDLLPDLVASGHIALGGVLGIMDRRCCLLFSLNVVYGVDAGSKHELFRRRS